MIDNYDSFVYNLVRYFKELNQEIIVVRNDAITISEMEQLNPEGIILSPGPKSPKDVPLLGEIIGTLGHQIPILGICLGHQAIAAAFGARIVEGKSPMHGKISKVFHNGTALYDNVPPVFSATRYHSLMVDPDSLPDSLEITSTSEDGVIMGIRHKKLFIEGLQFHPEAECSEYGHEILRNFIAYTKRTYN